MINTEILREYDIRGIYGKSLKADDIVKIASKLSNIIYKNNSNKIIIGHDGRLSSLEIKNTLIDIFKKNGLEIIDISLVPTPISYFANKYLKIPNLIMITGSHNPKEYNGLKIIINNKPFYGNDIKSLNEVEIDEIKCTDGLVKFINPIEKYKDDILKKFSNVNKLKVVWDPGNGAIGHVIKQIVNIIGGENVILNSCVDGNFPNHHPDPTIKKNITQISNFIKKNSFDMGVAFDGDGDRVGIIDNNGELIYSDIIFLLLALDMKKEKNNLVAVADIKCSKILFDTLKKKGVKILMSKTGHSLIKEMIAKENADIAGEMSGHIFFNYQYYGYDDAIYASLKLIKLLNSHSKSLNQLVEPFLKSFSTPEIKLFCEEKNKFNLLDNIVKVLISKYKNNSKIIRIDGIRIESRDYWFLIRASNTQNCLVFRLEHFVEQNFKNELDKIIKILGQFKIDLSELESFNNTV